MKTIKVLDSYNEMLYIGRDENNKVKVFAMDGYKGGNCSNTLKIYDIENTENKADIEIAYDYMGMHFFICNECGFHKYHTPEETKKLNFEDYHCQCGKHGKISRTVIEKGKIGSGNLTFCEK